MAYNNRNSNPSSSSINRVQGNPRDQSQNRAPEVDTRKIRAMKFRGAGRPNPRLGISFRNCRERQVKSKDGKSHTEIQLGATQYWWRNDAQQESLATGVVMIREGRGVRL